MEVSILTVEGLIMFNIKYENSPGILTYDSSIAIVLYGDNINLELINQSLEICKEKFKSHKDVSYFYEITSTPIWENLFQSAFKKRKFEIDNKMDFHYVIAINVKNTNLLEVLTFHDVKCPDFSLYYFSGFFNRDSMKTSINDSGFYCTSRIFDAVSSFVTVREKILKLACDDKTFGDDSPEHAFYYYLKTLNLKTYCANTTTFNEVYK